MKKRTLKYEVNLSKHLFRGSPDSKEQIIFRCKRDVAIKIIKDMDEGELDKYFNIKVLDPSQAVRDYEFLINMSPENKSEMQHLYESHEIKIKAKLEL